MYFRIGPNNVIIKILTGEVSEDKEYMLFVKTENDEQIIDIEERIKEEPKKKVRKKKGE